MFFHRLYRLDVRPGPDGASSMAWSSEQALLGPQS